MKHLFFVSVALGIFSGTSISGKAQISVNSLRFEDGISPKRSEIIIEGNPEVNAATKQSITVLPAFQRPSSVKSNNDQAFSIENCSLLQFKYGQLMNREVETVTNFTLYNFIDEWWATRYRYGGSTKNGIDCSAFSGTLMAKVFGIQAPRTARDMYANCEKIDREKLMEGDLVFFNTRGGVSHVGVYLGDGFFTHASVGNGVTISNLGDAYYNRKFIGGGRLNTPIDISE